jgi:hypothetical protein
VTALADAKELGRASVRAVQEQAIFVSLAEGAMEPDEAAQSDIVLYAMARDSKSWASVGIAKAVEQRCVCIATWHQNMDNPDLCARIASNGRNLQQTKSTINASSKATRLSRRTLALQQRASALNHAQLVT